MVREKKKQFGIIINTKILWNKRHLFIFNSKVILLLRLQVNLSDKTQAELIYRLLHEEGWVLWYWRVLVSIRNKIGYVYICVYVCMWRMIDYYHPITDTYIVYSVSDVHKCMSDIFFIFKLKSRWKWYCWQIF